LLHGYGLRTAEQADPTAIRILCFQVNNAKASDKLNSK
jgi:hypothetical protein